MTLQKREKWLAIAVGALMVIVGGRVLLPALFSPLSSRQREVDDLQVKIDKTQSDLKRAAAAQAKLAEWRKQSLPSDLRKGQSLYHNWLLELARDKVKFRKLTIDPGEPHPQKARLVRGESGAPPIIYQLLPFTIRCDGSLEQLSQFLYEFYAAGHLHRIRQLSVKPNEKSGYLELLIGVDALSLPDADRRDQLAQAPSGRLAFSEATYSKTIVDRNLFAAYKPPPPPRREERPREPPVKPPSTFDPAMYAYVTAIVSKGDERKVWVTSRIKDQQIPLAEGERFEIGRMKGTIVHINGRDVEIESEGRRWTVALGGPLRASQP